MLSIILVLPTYICNIIDATPQTDFSYSSITYWIIPEQCCSFCLKPFHLTGARAMRRRSNASYFEAF